MTRARAPICAGEQRRVALVTGAARGIGAATVLGLAARGWSVLAVDCVADEPVLRYPMATPADLTEVATRAGGSVSRRGAVRSFVADVRDPDALRAAVEFAVGTWGGLDAAISAAGVIAGGMPLWEMPAEQERAVLDICLGGVSNLARAAIPALLARPVPRSGRFLAVSSAAAIEGVPMLASYCAANAGIVGMVRALAAELGGTGITANAVGPGATATTILTECARLYRESGGDRRGLPRTGRVLDPAEVAAVLAFLAGPDSGAVTGSVIAADGGLSAPMHSVGAGYGPGAGVSA
ncbi:mycofactocin-coupled SDR family oxidoreductase [Nocardia higoensis]|uniref:mycofactocin-coupled SDR family oxidoreductase n=1 Tax=Nocardia higoensis TaxID=228599 RepID=UPI0002EFFBE2|nr:mycofactocin-coupled SDR family oxidoreductase [Nocardia higoensis]